MTYTSLIDNVRAKKWGLTIQEAYVFSFFHKLPSWAEHLTMGNDVYYRWSKQKAIDEIPLLTDKTDTIYRYAKILQEKGLIMLIKIGKSDYCKLTEKGKEWNRIKNNPNDGKFSTDMENLPINLGKSSEKNSENLPTNKYTNSIKEPIIKESDKEISRTQVKKFKKPSLDELSRFMLSYSKNKDFSFTEDDTDNFASDFLDFYESKGWKVGTAQMKDWEAAARRWLKGNFEKKKNKNLKASKNYGNKNPLESLNKHDTSHIDYGKGFWNS